MDETTKLLKSILVINIITIVIIVVVFGLQIFQTINKSDKLTIDQLQGLQKDIDNLQKQLEKSSTTNTSQNQQQQNGIQQPIGGMTGKCGDGTCDSIEKEKGVCPSDCE